MKRSVFSETLDSGLKILREELEGFRKKERRSFLGRWRSASMTPMDFLSDLTTEILQDEGMTF